MYRLQGKVGVQGEWDLLRGRVVLHVDGYHPGQEGQDRERADRHQVSLSYLTYLRGIILSYLPRHDPITTRASVVCEPCVPFIARIQYGLEAA